MTEKKSLFSRLREGLFKSREHMSVAMEAAVQDCARSACGSGAP